MSTGNRWDVMSIREYQSGNETKTSWTKCGVGFTNQNGSINIILELIPVPVDGEVKLQLQVPLTKEEREAKFGSHGQAQRQNAQQGGHYPSNDGNRGARPAPGRGFAGGGPTRAPQQQQRGNAQRYNNRGPSNPQQQQFGPGPAPEYQPDPQQGNPAGYDEGPYEEQQEGGEGLPF